MTFLRRQLVDTGLSNNRSYHLAKCCSILVLRLNPPKNHQDLVWNLFGCSLVQFSDRIEMVIYCVNVLSIRVSHTSLFRNAHQLNQALNIRHVNLCHLQKPPRYGGSPNSLFATQRQPFPLKVFYCIVDPDLKYPIYLGEPLRTIIIHNSGWNVPL